MERHNSKIMLTFKKSSTPAPSVGEDYSNEIDQVVPDQNMSLEEILTRFTRGETLPVGFDVQEGDADSDNPLNIDLEKIANSDLVDKEEFINKLRQVQQEYEKQEAEKAAALKAKKEEEFKKLDEKRIRIAARKLAKTEAKKS